MNIGAFIVIAIAFAFVVVLEWRKWREKEREAKNWHSLWEDRLK